MNRKTFSPEAEALYAKASMALDDELFKEIIRYGLRQGDYAFLCQAFPAALNKVEGRLAFLSQILSFAASMVKGNELAPECAETVQKYLKGEL